MSNGANDQGLKLRYWLALGYSIPIILAILSAVAVYWNAQTVKTKQEELLVGIEIGDLMSDAAFNIQIVSRATRGYLLDPDPASVNSFENAKGKIQENLKALEGLIRDEQQQQTLKEIQTTYQELESFNQQLINLVNAGKQIEAVAEWKRDKGRDLAEQMANLLESFDEREGDIISEGAAGQTTAINQLFWVVILSTGLSVLASAAFGTWIISSIARRMNQAASTIAASSSEIAATMEQQERTAGEQAASVNETTTTISELGASSRQSAQQAEAAANAAAQALRLAEGGNKAVEETVENMTALKDKVGAIADQILHLGEQTSQIGNISDLVSDLANQTNMLALNAAVEAVRAGEHGKGFAVVAAEIRKLADQSRQSAEKIGNLVTQIQHSINSTVMVTDEGTKTVDSGMLVTEKTAQAFSGVTDAVNNVVINNQQISLNIKQQAAAVEQVVEAMNIINQGAKETATGITQTRLGTEQLNEVTANLEKMV
ncbi:MAG: CHASE3 domain-containing protein [Gomphosphaeria aponina SAG 52.96 = DSM 107014]|uniref:CHASE3 domain-containing protein n=1 Tax=Gomphosphaeria aponina SAG 52.96 = DSM 107014 TaxID=1521640 RepID=A0A941GX39_9CHRO|nr:CHASE3 domain-containing protein [Gomphosphaeria aponina SAG 52.96 = DSM 107014]